jgi:hypothetical protein
VLSTSIAAPTASTRDHASWLKRDEVELPREALAAAVKHRMWDVPAELYCELIADRFGRAYRRHDTAALVELAGLLLPTGPLRRAVDERLEVPFLQELGEQLAEERPH